MFEEVAVDNWHHIAVTLNIQVDFDDEIDLKEIKHEIISSFWSPWIVMIICPGLLFCDFESDVIMHFLTKL